MLSTIREAVGLIADILMLYVVYLVLLYLKEMLTFVKSLNSLPF